MPPVELDDVQIESSAIESGEIPEYKTPEQMTSAERDNWLLKGEIPLAGASPAESSRPSDEDAESAATPAGGVGDEPAAAKPAPVSQPVKKQEQQAKRTKQETPAQKRIRELLAENERLRGAQPAVAQPAQPSAQPAATPPAAKPAAAEDPKPVRASKPDGSKWKDWNEYEEAKDAWLIREGARQAEARRVEKDAATTQQQAEQQLKASWAERCVTAEKDPDMPDFKTVAFQQGLMINPTTKAFLYTSEQGPKILYTLQRNPQIAQQLAGADPLTTARVLVTLENALANGKGKPAGAAAAAPAQPGASRTKPTKTPDPAVDIAGRNSAPADELEAAVRNDDFRKFYELDTRRATASLQK